ncbi:Cocaine esterase [Fusarium oxysporum f. sp. albedinis]|nr:Cocaine esterase [Fusarium oxysporum f. sp. albedinis]
MVGDKSPVTLAPMIPERATHDNFSDRSQPSAACIREWCTPSILCMDDIYFCERLNAYSTALRIVPNQYTFSDPSIIINGEDVVVEFRCHDRDKSQSPRGWYRVGIFKTTAGH